MMQSRKVHSRFLFCGIKVKVARSTPGDNILFLLAGMPGASRRHFLHSAAASLLVWSTVKPAFSQDAPVVRLDLAPDQRQYDPADDNLRDAAYLLQKALNAEQVQVKLYTASASQ